MEGGRVGVGGGKEVGIALVLWNEAETGLSWWLRQ